MDGFEFVPGKVLEVTPQIQQQFERDGYVIIKWAFNLLCRKRHIFPCRSLLQTPELEKLKSCLESENGILQYSYSRDDGHGKKNKVCLWNHPGEDLTGMVGRCRKVAGTMEQLLGGEVYHYHTKLMMKEAHTGGSFVWHQDYGLAIVTNTCVLASTQIIFIPY